MLQQNKKHDSYNKKGFSTRSVSVSEYHFTGMRYNTNKTTNAIINRFKQYQKQQILLQYSLRYYKD